MKTPDPDLMATVRQAIASQEVLYLSEQLYKEWKISPLFAGLSPDNDIVVIYYLIDTDTGLERTEAHLADGLRRTVLGQFSTIFAPEKKTFYRGPVPAIPAEMLQGIVRLLPEG